MEPRDRTSYVVFRASGRESLMGVIGRPLAPDAVRSTGFLVLLAWICCCVDTMATHSLVFAESGPLGRS